MNAQRKSKMYQIAVVEDSSQESTSLISLLVKYEKENDLNFKIDFFQNGFLFLDAFEPNYDLIFMDIAMPGINGMDVSKKIREVDEQVLLVFVTSLTQYALQGYKVGAIDYLVKPVTYDHLKRTLSRVLAINLRKEEDAIVIKTSDGLAKLVLDDIISLTANDHMIIYQTKTKEYMVWTSLKKALEELPNDCFYKLNKSTIINLGHVKGVKNSNVIMSNEDVFLISRGKKGEFVSVMSKFLNE